MVVGFFHEVLQKDVFAKRSFSEVMDMGRGTVTLPMSITSENDPFREDTFFQLLSRCSNRSSEAGRSVIARKTHLQVFGYCALHSKTIDREKIRSELRSTTLYYTVLLCITHYYYALHNQTIEH